MWYRSPANGSAFIAINNEADGVARMEVSLAPLHQLPAGRDFEAVLWDGLTLFSRIASGDSEALSSRIFALDLEPNSTRVLAFVPPGTL